MKQKEQKVEQHHALEDYGNWLLFELKKEDIILSVVGKNGLRIKGEITSAQKEYIRLWKRQLIEALSPKCSICTSPMQLIDNDTLWFCPFGCQGKNENRVSFD